MGNISSCDRPKNMVEGIEKNEKKMKDVNDEDEDEEYSDEENEEETHLNRESIMSSIYVKLENNLLTPFNLLKNRKTKNNDDNDISQFEIFNITDTVGDLHQLKNYEILPSLVFHNIILNINLKDLYSLMLTCKLFFKIINTKKLWRDYYKLFFENEENEENQNFKKLFFENYSFKFNELSVKKGNEECDVNLKCIFLGECCVGRSTYLTTLQKGYYMPFEESTIGASFQNIFASIRSKGKNIRIKYDVWDLAGQEKYRGLYPMYYGNTHFFFLCYSIDFLTTWKRLILEFKAINKYLNMKNMKTSCFILIGFKLDLNKKREVPIETVEKFVLDNKLVLDYCELSSKDSINMNIPFIIASRAISINL